MCPLGRLVAGDYTESLYITRNGRAASLDAIESFSVTGGAGPESVPENSGVAIAIAILSMALMSVAYRKIWIRRIVYTRHKRREEIGLMSIIIP